MTARFRPPSGDALLRRVVRMPVVRERVAELAERGADLVRASARAEAYDSGDYLRSVSVRHGEVDGEPVSTFGAGGGKAYYGHILEYGSAKRPPLAIVRRAAAKLRPKP